MQRPDAFPEAGFHQVETPDNATARVYPQARPRRLPRRGYRRFLSRAMDSPDDYLLRSYVLSLLVSCSPPYASCLLGAASFTIYSRTKEYYRDRHWLARNRIFDVSAVGGIRYYSR